MASELKKTDEREPSALLTSTGIHNPFKPKSKKAGAISEKQLETSEKVVKASDAPFYRLYANATNVFRAKSRTPEGIKTLSEKEPPLDKTVAGTAVESEKAAGDDTQAKRSTEDPPPLPPKTENRESEQVASDQTADHEVAGVVHRLSANINKIFRPNFNSEGSANVGNVADNQNSDSSTPKPSKAGLRLPTFNNLFQPKAKDEGAVEAKPVQKDEGIAAEEEPAVESAKDEQQLSGRIANLLKARPKAAIVITPPPQEETAVESNLVNEPTAEFTAAKFMKVGHQLSGRVGNLFKPQAKEETSASAENKPGGSGEVTTEGRAEEAPSSSFKATQLARRLSSRAGDLFKPKPKVDEIEATAVKDEATIEDQAEQPAASASAPTSSHLARRLSTRVGDLLRPKLKIDTVTSTEVTPTEGEAAAESQPEQDAPSPSVAKVAEFAHRLSTRAGDLFKSKPKTNEIAPTSGEATAEDETEQAPPSAIKATQLARSLSSRAGDLFKSKPKAEETAATEDTEGEASAETQAEQPVPSAGTSKSLQLARRLSTRAGDLFKPKAKTDEVVPTEAEAVAEGQTEQPPAASRATQLARRLSSRTGDLFKAKPKVEGAEALPAEGEAAAETQSGNEQPVLSTSRGSQLARRLSTRAGDLFKPKPKAEQVTPAEGETPVEGETAHVEANISKALPLPRRLSTRAADIFKKPKVEEPSSTSEQAEGKTEPESAAIEGGETVVHRLSTQVASLFKSKGKGEGEASNQEGETSTEQPPSASIKATKVARQLSDFFQVKPRIEEVPASSATEGVSRAVGTVTTSDDAQAEQAVSEPTLTLPRRLTTRVGGLFKPTTKIQDTGATENVEGNADTESESPPVPPKPQPTLASRLSTSISAFMKVDLKYNNVGAEKVANPIEEASSSKQEESEAPVEAAPRVDGEGAAETPSGAVKASQVARRLSTRAQDLFKSKPKAEGAATSNEGAAKKAEDGGVEGQTVKLNKSEDELSSETIKFGRKLSARVGDLFRSTDKDEEGVVLATKKSEAAVEQTPEESPSGGSNTASVGKRLSIRAANLLKPKPKLEDIVSPPPTEANNEESPSQPIAASRKATEIGRRFSLRVNEIFTPKTKSENSAADTKGETAVETNPEEHAVTAEGEGVPTQKPEESSTTATDVLAGKSAPLSRRGLSTRLFEVWVPRKTKEVLAERPLPAKPVEQSHEAEVLPMAEEKLASQEIPKEQNELVEQSHEAEVPVKEEEKPASESQEIAEEKKEPVEQPHDEAEIPVNAEETPASQEIGEEKNEPSNDALVTHDSVDKEEAKETHKLEADSSAQDTEQQPVVGEDPVADTVPETKA